MTKDKLQQYRSLVDEIDELKKRMSHRESVIDSVSRSNPNFPYEKQIVTIEGAENNQRMHILEKRIKRCEKLKLDIEIFIANIPDSKTRRIFEMRYFYGWSWQKISFKLRGSESYSRMIHDRYLDKKA